MRILSISSLIYLVCFLPIKSNGQGLATTIQVKKTDMASYKDIKPLIASAYPDKIYETCQVQSFVLAGSYIENNTPISFTEFSPCGTLTEKQQTLIDKYGKQGVVFTLEKIMMTKFGIPGTPYNPDDKVSISVSPILITIKE